MNLITSLFADMRQKKLWPIALLLVVLLVAVPILLSKTSSPVPVASLPVPPGTVTTPNVPSITQQSNPIHSRLTGHKRDPFTQGGKAKSTTTKTSTTTPKATTSTTTASGTKSTTAEHAASTTASSTAHSSTGSGSATTTTTGGGTTTTSSGHTTTPTSPGRAKPAAPAGLTPTEVYDVSFSITNGSGGFDTVNSLERLSVLPSARKPLLVELGVLKGGKSVLFAVQRGASVSGPGRCIPGPVDCELLSMRPGEVEALSGSTPGGMVYTEFSVTQIRVGKLKSKRKADQARGQRSGAGLSMLSNSTGSVLSLFDYKPQLGAIVDLRNLGIAGGS